MKVLVVLAQPPAHEGNAPARGALALIRGLTSHGVDVTAIAARQHFPDDRPAPSGLPVEIVDFLELPPPRRSSYRRRIRYPRSALVGPFSQRVRELAADADVVHLDETETAWCSAGVDKPTCLHIHFRTLRDRRVPAPWRPEFRFVAEYAAAELVAKRRHAYLVASSHEVAASLRRLNGHSEVVVVPYGLDPAHYLPAALDGPPCAGIIGTGYWPPTANALRRLERRVWPRVHEGMPNARLLIAGRGIAPPTGWSPGAMGVDYLGEVETAAHFLAQLHVLLYPVTRGSGVKVKVLESMACGVPVVTTSRGAEGVAPNDGIVVCETDEDLATAALRILTDEDERRERGAAGRASFLRSHTPGPSTAPLVELFRRMLTAA